jgi:hypothetical protein
MHQLAKVQKLFGNPLAPLECFLLARGMRTLHVRMERHGENAMQARPRGVLGLESDCNDAHPPHALNPICAKPR